VVVVVVVVVVLLLLAAGGGKCVRGCVAAAGTGVCCNRAAVKPATYLRSAGASSRQDDGAYFESINRWKLVPAGGLVFAGPAAASCVGWPAVTAAALPLLLAPSSSNSISSQHAAQATVTIFICVTDGRKRYDEMDEISSV
jgi:hypothetical protein